MDKPLTDDMFKKALFDEDELGSVIRVRLHVEYHVNIIIQKLVPYSEDLKPINLDYDGKVNLICALGVKPEYKKLFSALGNMRNKFAHNPFYKLTKSEVNNLYKSLSVEDKEILQKAHNKTRNQAKGDKVKPFKDLEPRDQFILIAVLIRTMAIQISDEITAKTVYAKASLKLH